MSPPSGSPTQSDHAAAHAWMVINTEGLSYAVASDLIDVVFRTQEAEVTHLAQPAGRVEVHQGKPWWVLPLSTLAVRQEFGHPDAVQDAQWTLGLRHPSGVAIHVQSIEGPFKGLAMDQTLKTAQGDWPLLEWRS